MNTRVCVCICTRNRPADLAWTLESLDGSTVPVWRTVVSDDSTSSKSHALVTSRFAGVTYVTGPRRGLGANRNRALEAAAGDFVLFLDDDCRLGPTFIARMLEHHAGRPSEPPRDRVIVTGRETNNGRFVEPGEQTYLGFQSRPATLGRARGAIVINSTLFPLSLFEQVRFDERLVYGYDEVDVVAGARRQGFVVEWCPEAVNHHYPSPVNRDYYSPFRHGSRLYVTWKRRHWAERHPARAAGYLVLGSLHLVASEVRRGGARGGLDAFRAIRQAGGHIASWRSSTNASRECEPLRPG